jgi:hypothetical protein
LRVLFFQDRNGDVGATTTFATDHFGSDFDYLFSDGGSISAKCQQLGKRR